MPTNLDRVRDAALQLLPQGRAFARSIESGVGAFIEGACEEFARVQDALDLLWLNSAPDEAEAYLSDWENALGLPEACRPVPETLEERQLAVVEKLRGRGSFGRAVWEAMITEAGFTLYQAQHYAPFEVGRSAVGEALYGDAWLSTTRLRVIDNGGDPAVLLCALNAYLRRAHTHLLIEIVAGA